ncbi:MAG TPA: ATP-binding protein [Acidimicrobiales bacterium]|jgi:signal transduction histidine kinase|nr:ATP-binding protein [Acidimicrobiales bacterium]
MTEPEDVDAVEPVDRLLALRKAVLEGGEGRLEGTGTVLGTLDGAVRAIERLQAQLRAAHDEQRRRQARHSIDAARFHLAPVALVITDRAGVIREANRRAIELLASDTGSTRVGRTLLLHVEPRDRIVFDRVLRELEGGRSRTTTRLQLRARGGTTFYGLLRAQAIEETIAWAIEDISSSVRLEEQANRAIARQEEVAAQYAELDATRTAFLLAVSHDLRAPIAAVAGLADVLIERGGHLDTGEAQRALRHIRSSATELTDVLNDLLDIQRLAQGGVVVQASEVPIAKLVEAALAEVDLDGREVDVDVDDAVALADPGLLRRVLTNLIKNVVSHTPEATTVWLRCRTEPDGVLVVVEDDGPGMSDEDKTHAFDLFFRGRSVGQPSGLGVGLALVRRFTELQGGHVRVEDRAGGGASFHVVLPVWTGEGSSGDAAAAPS